MGKGVPTLQDDAAPCLNQKHDEHTSALPMKPTDDDNEAKRTNNLMPSMTATIFKTKTREVLSEKAR